MDFVYRATMYGGGIVMLSMSTPEATAFIVYVASVRADSSPQPEPVVLRK